MLLKIKQALEKEGFGFPFPQREVWFANEDKNRDGQPASDGGVEHGGESAGP
jgi:small-conductance mechanosensitive channel